MRPLSTFPCIYLVVLLSALGAAAFRTMDRLTDPGLDGASAAATADAGAADAPVEHTGSRRMFVFVIDSLRYETAVDPQRMPYLCSMQSAGVWARMQTVHDAVTVPALRAAFTGKDRVSVFGFVKNFWHRDEGFSSLFTQLAEEGFRTGVWCDGSFKQFESDLAKRSFNRQGEGHDIERQNQAVEQAIAAYLNREYDLVIAHVTYSDDVAHQGGIYQPKYRVLYGALDDLVQRLDRTVARDETLVIMGDHGHDEAGRHMMGLDVPTFALYRGPAYRPGTNLGTVPIMDTRFLMSFGLKLALPANYPSGRHPDALVPSGPLPDAYARQFDALAAQEAGAGVPVGRRLDYFLTMAGLALLTALWVALARADKAEWLVSAGAWPALAALTFPDLVPGGTFIGLVVAALLLVRVLARAGWSVQPALWVALPLVGALAFERWGYVLALIRPSVHWPQIKNVVVAVWCVVVVLGAALTWRYGAVRVIWLIAAVAGGLLYPSVYEGGTPATMAPLWLVALGLLLLDALRRGHEGSGAPAPTRLFGPLAALALIALLLSPFLVVNSVHFQFSTWFGPIADIFFGNHKVERLLVPGLLLAFLAKIVVFARRDSPVAVKVAAVMAALLVQALEMGLLQRGVGPALSRQWIAGTEGQTFAVGQLTVAGAIAVVSVVLARRGGSTARQLARLGVLAALYVLWLYSVRIPRDAYLWLDCLLAALVLSGRLVSGLRGRAPHESNYLLLLLLLLGTLAAGWVGLAWTFHRLEWGFLYDWFPSYLIEWNVGAFLPPIVARYVIPLIMIRIVLAGELAAVWRYPQRAIILVAGLKTLSVLMVACGIGYRDVHSDVYLEAVQETAIWGLLFTALPWVKPTNVAPCRDALRSLP